MRATSLAAVLAALLALKPGLALCAGPPPPPSGGSGGGGAPPPAPPPSGGGTASGGQTSAPPPSSDGGSYSQPPPSSPDSSAGGGGYSPSGAPSGSPPPPPASEVGGSWGSLAPSRPEAAEGRSENSRSPVEDAQSAGEALGGAAEYSGGTGIRQGRGMSNSSPATSSDAGGVFRSERYEKDDPSVGRTAQRRPLPELEDEDPKPMPLADAKVNFETVVQIYLSKKAPNGVLKVPAGTTGRTIPVKIGEVDPKTVVFSGQGRYTGIAKGADLRKKRPLLIEMTVDLSAGGWEVEEVRVLPGGVAPTSETIRARGLFALAVRRHVRGIAAASGGVFALRDDVLKKRWELKMGRIHQNKLASLGQGRYLACVDFEEDGGGQEVDLDFYALQTKEGWKIEKTLIHAVRGVPRFAYDENYKIVPYEKR